LERCARGVYCGAIGMVRPGGDALFSVAIRTTTIDRSKDEATYNVGGGITWESKVHDEYDEALSKANVLLDTGSEFDLVETLKLDCGEFTLRQRHVDRITDSARYFGRPLKISDAESALSCCGDSNPDGAWRIRLLADRFGMLRTECAPMKPIEGKQTFTMARRHVSSRDRFLFHKTSNRGVYERAAEGCGNVFDVLLSNEHGELTEFTRGNLVVEVGAAMLTPPRTCGLLAGTFREEMLTQGKIVEQVVTLEMLKQANRIWFINSVHGWVEMEQLLE
jgi:para-aminobenzoate synthetase/4-amino-4-deoxychorismate lyase